jgi:hypothetical protein
VDCHGFLDHLLGAVEKLRKLASSCMSVIMRESTRLRVEGFSSNLIFMYFLKYVENIKVIFSPNKKRTLSMKKLVHMSTHLRVPAIFFPFTK